MYDEDYYVYQHLSTSPKNYVLKSYPGKKVIKYHLLGGTMDEKGKILPGDATTYGNLPTPTKEGREFLGWSESSNGSSIINASTNLPTGNSFNLYAVWSKPRALLLGGESVNTKMKKLTGDTSPNSYSINTSIKEIKRASSLTAITLGDDNIISTSDSTVPVYAWFDNGTIYYYSTEEKIFMPYSSSYMFKNLQGLETIDISTFDSSETRDYYGMFDGDSSLKKLDLSNFDTGYANGLSDMFSNCTSLEELDISSFDLHYSDWNGIFSNDTSLKRLKTPKRSTHVEHPNGLKNLPVPMMDDEGNVYTVLNGFVPAQTWLVSQS